MSPTLPLPTENLVGLNFGGFNLHVDIKFNDAIVWLARFRLLQINRPCPETVEAATYRLLRNASIPVPRVFYHAPDGDSNDVGAGYISGEKLPGRPMEWFNASEQPKAHFIDQLADIYIQLEKVQQPYIGGPVFKNVENETGVVVELAFFDYDVDSSCVPYEPFSTSIE
jgi:hypothetical protein